MKILILCTGNSCRSQMAEGFLRSFDATLEVFSAGTHPEKEINPRTVIVMNELGIDMRGNKPKQVDIYASADFDYVITVCDDAKERCPVFAGDVKHRLHIGFEDPANARGTDEEVLPVYRKIRDEIRERFSDFYQTL
ncbi:MAG: arsenate reductase ArsC [Bacteroidales bacterium]|nr:arsenate reductase ArsC [Bacteroidales bacterium]